MVGHFGGGEGVVQVVDMSAVLAGERGFTNRAERGPQPPQPCLHDADHHSARTKYRDVISA